MMRRWSCRWITIRCYTIKNYNYYLRIRIIDCICYFWINRILHCLVILLVVDTKCYVTLEINFQA